MTTMNIPRHNNTIQLMLQIKLKTGRLYNIKNSANK